MNYKRKRSRRQVRDTLATTHRWRGNEAGRFAPGVMEAEPEDSKIAPLPAHKPSRGKFVLQAKLIPSSCMPGMAFLLRRFGDWSTFKRYHSQGAAEQGMASAVRQQGHYLNFRVREAG